LAAFQDARYLASLFARLVFFVVVPQPGRRYRSVSEPSFTGRARDCANGADAGSTRLTGTRSARAGHFDILNTSFETFEQKIRDQLTRILGPGGFDPDRDIEAITVNRWPHGYAYEYNPLFDPDWPEGNAPHVIGRTPFGRITIANSDAGAAAYTDCAIDQGYRAVQELFHT
jgi:hypothetical protein